MDNKAVLDDFNQDANVAYAVWQALIAQNHAAAGAAGEYYSRAAWLCRNAHINISAGFDLGDER